MVSPAVVGDHQRLGIRLEHFPGFPQSVQCVVALTELGQCPRGAGKGRGASQHDVPAPECLEPTLAQLARRAPFTLEGMKRACGEIGMPDAIPIASRLGETDTLGFVGGGLGESAELGETHGEPGAIKDGRQYGASEFVEPVSRRGSEIFGGQLDDPLVLGTVIMQLWKLSRYMYAETQVP